MSRFPSGSRNWTKATLPMSTTSEASSAPRSRTCATTAPRSSAHQKKRGGPSGVNGAFASRARPGPGSIGTSTIVSSCEGRDTSAPSSLPYQSAERWMSRTGMKTWPISRRIGVVTAQSYATRFADRLAGPSSSCPPTRADPGGHGQGQQRGDQTQRKRMTPRATGGYTAKRNSTEFLHIPTSTAVSPTRYSEPRLPENYFHILQVVATLTPWATRNRVSTRTSLPSKHSGYSTRCLRDHDGSSIAGTT